MAKRGQEQRRAGRPPMRDAPKVCLNLRLSADIVASLRARPGYNVRVDALLRKALDDGRL